MRRAAVTKVQIARRELGLDDDVYRSILQRVTGRTSSTACTDAELGRVLDEFAAKGWKPKMVQGGKAAPLRGRSATIIIDDPMAPHRRRQPRADHPSAKKARALWLSLWNLGEVDDPSETALEAMARRQLKVERLQWADQGLTYKLIEALKDWGERAGWSQDVSGHPKGTDRVKVLKVTLIRAQTRRLGQVRQAAMYMDWTHAELNALIARQGAEIRARAAG